MSDLGIESEKFMKNIEGLFGCAYPKSQNFSDIYIYIYIGRQIGWLYYILLFVHESEILEYDAFTTTPPKINIFNTL